MRIYLNKWHKRGIAFLSDVTVTIAASFMANWLLAKSFFTAISQTALITTISCQCLLYIVCGLYRGVWRFASIPDLLRIIRAIFIGCTINLLYLLWVEQQLALKFYIIDALLLVTMLASSRFVFRLHRYYPILSRQAKRILIVGAGHAGEGLIRDLYRSSLIQEYYPFAIVDDNLSKHGSEVQGVRIIGSCQDIPKLVQKYKIDMVLIAIPSMLSRRMREIVNLCEQANVAFRTLPGLKAIADGNIKVDTLREVLIEDLLGREPVNHDLEKIKTLINDKTILVTGGGGSIGSELCRQIYQLEPKHLIIVDNNEFNLYSIDMELKKLKQNVELHTRLCDVTDEVEIESIFNAYQPHIVFHVAAYKHVPLLEEHIRIAMHNNIIGTKIVANLANKFNVDTFTLISTDKAVNPSSIMGATKRAAEIYCQTLNLQSKTRFITIRFGNVLDSAGSVIPLFRKQLQQGGPLTVTHPEITRYFMTIPEAAQLILQAMSLNNEGEIFVLDMGEPIYIRYLAEQMIKLSGKLVDQDINIIYTGLRPGEKLYEELFYDTEFIGKTSHPKINQAKARHYDWLQLTEIMRMIQGLCHEQTHDQQKLLDLLQQLVPEYQGKQLNQTSEHSLQTDPSTMV